MTIGKRIKKLRTDINMSQVDFAALIGVSKQTLYKYENDIITNIPSDKIELIAEKTNTTPAYIMGWELSDEEIGEVFYQDMLRAPEKKSRYQSPSHAETVFIDMVRSILEEELKKEQLDALNKRIKERLPKDFGMPKSTLAAHFDGDEYTEEELDEIRQFAEFVKNKRK